MRLEACVSFALLVCYAAGSVSSQGAVTPAEPVEPAGVTWIEGLPRAEALARKTGRPLLLVFR